MYNSVFQKDWWLEAVAPGSWGVATVKRGEKTAARLPYVRRKKLGMNFLIMPPLTQTLGPWLRPSEAKYAKALGEAKDLQQELIELLPPFHLYVQNFHYSAANWLPFYWSGFSQTTYYTYVIKDLEDEEKIWAGFLDRVRTDIRKAESKLNLTDNIEIAEFIEFYLKHSRDGAIPRDFKNLVRRIDDACAGRKSRRITKALDSFGKTHAVMYIVWDQISAYYLLGAMDDEEKGSGAASFLIWDSIKFSSGVTKRFDFEGSMNQSIERFFRGFGAEQIPYFRIYKYNSRLLKVLEKFRII